MQDLIDVADREEFVAIELIVRALQISRRTLLKSWDRDGVPYVREGRSVRLRSDIVRARYYPDRATLPEDTRTNDASVQKRP